MIRNLIAKARNVLVVTLGGVMSGAAQRILAAPVSSPASNVRPLIVLSSGDLTLARDWAEQDSRDWWHAALTAGRQCLAGQDARRIAASGLSSQREGVVPIGRDGQPLSRCIIWMDRRCRPQCARLGEEFGDSFLHHHTGVAPDPNYTGCKLLWLRENQPELLERAAIFLQPRDFLYYRLTGKPAMDYTLASRTMMLDLRREAWWPEMFARVGIRVEQFPPLSAPSRHRTAWRRRPRPHWDSPRASL